ncbi:MAG: hypothetical protein KDH88_19725 [Chromatiales bacterium]|nr:hypothetical protein [Chromatiales bacterium]
MSDNQLTENETRLFELLKAHDYAGAVALIPSVERINEKDPETGMTALHWAAAHAVHGLRSALYQRPDLDELVLDAEQRYPSDLARAIAQDEALGAELQTRERQYAERTGKTAWPRPESP